MQLLILLLGFFVVVLGQNCDLLGTLVYEDMACKPIRHGKTASPSKYECTGIEPSKDCCYYRNECLKVGQEIDRCLLQNCFFGCTCQEGLTFACISGKCPSCPYKKDCYDNKTLNQCCSCSHICPPFNDVKCVVDGRTYREGDAFTPKNTCWECVCRKGWRGVNEAPFCKRKRCEVQLFNPHEIQNACAPGYISSFDQPLCCPYLWICGDVCKFGKNTLKVGQYIHKQTKIWNAFVVHFICNCKLPPLLTCTTDFAYYNITTITTTTTPIY